MMTIPDRISRAERKKLRKGKRAGIALSLALLLFCLVVVDAYRGEIKKLIYDKIVPKPDHARFTALADSLIASTVAEFGLDDSLRVLSTAAGRDSLVHRRYAQSWPEMVPAAFFVRRLQAAARDKKLRCDCIEYESRTECSIRYDGSIAGELSLEDNRSTGLRGRRLAIIIKNAGAVFQEQIEALTDAGVSLAYVGSPNTFPSGKTKNALEKAGISTLLELPGKESLIMRPPSAKGGASKRTARDSEELAADLLARHPNTAALYIDRSGGYDEPFISGILRQARSMGIAYYYERSKPDLVDSLAYSGGLRIIRMKSLAELNAKTGEAFESALLNDLISPGYPASKIVMIDERNIGLGDILKLAATLRKLGVKIVNYIELSQTTENLLRVD